MRYIFLKWLSSLISLLVLLVFMVSFNYVVSRNEASRTQIFSLSPKAMVFKNNDEFISAEPSDIINIENDLNVTVITTDTEWDHAGIYDPRLFYATDNQIVMPGISRYFSNRDYVSRKNVSVLVKHHYMADVSERVGCMTQKNASGIPYLFCVDTYSKLYDSSIDEFINLISLPALGDTVYLDADSSSDLSDIARSLTDSGYTLVKQTQPNALNAFVNSFNQVGYHELLIIGSSSLLYVIFLFVCYHYFLGHIKLLSVHKFSGGNFRTMVKTFVLPLIVSNTIILLFSFLFYYFVQSNPNYIYFSLQYFLTLLTIHWIVATCFFFIGFSMNYWIVKYRGEKYVK